MSCHPLTTITKALTCDATTSDVNEIPCKIHWECSTVSLASQENLHHLWDWVPDAAMAGLISQALPIQRLHLCLAPQHPELERHRGQSHHPIFFRTRGRHVTSWISWENIIQAKQVRWADFINGLDQQWWINSSFTVLYTKSTFNFESASTASLYPTTENWNLPQATNIFILTMQFLATNWSEIS